MEEAGGRCSRADRPPAAARKEVRGRYAMDASPEGACRVMRARQMMEAETEKDELTGPVNDIWDRVVPDPRWQRRMTRGGTPRACV